MSVVSRSSKSVELIGSAKMHLSREDGAVTREPQAVSEGRDVGGKFGGIVVDARPRRPQPGHEGGAGGRAQGTCAISAVKDNAVPGKRLHMGRLRDRAAVDGQKGGGHLVGHDDEDVWRLLTHRCFLSPRLAFLDFDLPRSVRAASAPLAFVSALASVRTAGFLCSSSKTLRHSRSTSSAIFGS